jgi:DNA primase large subunit
MSIKRLELFYIDPKKEVDLQDLEKFSKERLKALKIIEIKPVFSNKKDSDTDMQIMNELRRAGILLDNESSIEIDNISHFILKLAVCRSQEESKSWINSEVALFRWRCGQYLNFDTWITNTLNLKKVASLPQIQEFHESHDSNLANHKSSSPGFFEVPLSLGASLLGKGYFPLKGKIYVTQEDLKAVACDIFRSGLMLALDEAQKVEITDERLLRLFKTLKDPDFDYGYKIKPGKERGVNLQNLSQLAENHFPPCMKKLYLKLSNESHLKHFGRLQLGLFVKGIGLSLEESLEFWRKKFTEKMTVEKFNKGYKYNIEHSYGRAGKMADYTPWSCTKITKMAKPAFGEHHGCPFRHAEKSELVSLIGSYQGVRPETKNWILERCEVEPQLACVKLFEDLRPGSKSMHTQKVGIHPNSFFDASFEYQFK